jgi:hypothetical protein
MLSHIVYITGQPTRRGIPARLLAVPLVSRSIIVILQLIASGPPDASLPEKEYRYYIRKFPNFFTNFEKNLIFFEKFLADSLTG